MVFFNSKGPTQILRYRATAYTFAKRKKHHEIMEYIFSNGLSTILIKFSFMKAELRLFYKNIERDEMGQKVNDILRIC